MSSSENDSQSHTDSASPSTLSSAVSTSLVNHIETWSTLCHHHFQSTHHIKLFLHHLVTTRVLFPHSVSKCSQLALVLNCYKEDDPRCFHHNLRVSPHAFNILLSLIKDHSIFYNQSNVDQLPVSFQLAIALHWFSTFGNSASVDSIAQWAGCSPGTIINSTQQVITATLPLHDQAICWPTAQEKHDASDWVERVSCHAWRPGYCMVDGTLVTLYTKPGHYGDQFFDHKSNYSLSLTVSHSLPSVLCG